MKNLYFVVLCCLLGFTTSCSDDDNATALLQIDPSTDLVFEAVGGTRTIEVKTDQATWQVESNQAWCKVYNRGIQMYRFPNSDVQKSVIFEGIKKRLKIV